MQAMWNEVRGTLALPASALIARGEKPGERLGWVDVARGMCMLLVVLMHVDELHYARLFGATPFAPLWEVVTGIAKPMRIPTFFAISGFLASRAVIRPWRTVFEKRVGLLYYVYAVWTLVTGVALTLLATADGPVSLPAAAAHWLPQLLWPDSILWFLFALILYFFGARLLRDLPVGLVLGAAMLVTALTYHLPGTHIARSFLYFLLGAYLPRLLPRLAADVRWRTLGIACAALIATTGLVVLVGKNKPGVWLPANFAGLWFCIAVSAWLAPSRLGRPLAALGRNTLPIFVLHPIVIAALNTALTHPLLPVRTAIARSAWASGAWPLAANLLVILGCLGIRQLFLVLRMPWLFTLPDLLKPRARSSDPVLVQPGS